MVQNDKQLPSLITQAQNYLMSYARWVAAGKPVRSPDYIAELFATFCEKCPSNNFIRVDKDSGRCVECGCWLKRKGIDKNKLAWPTEPCPEGHFNNDVEEPPEDN